MRVFKASMYACFQGIKNHTIAIIKLTDNSGRVKKI